MRKRYVYINRSLWLVKYAVSFFISVGVWFSLASTTHAEKEVACEECKPGVALPEETCRVDLSDDPKLNQLLKWNKAEKWAWKQICEGQNANFNSDKWAKELNPENPKREVLDLKKAKHDDKLLAMRKLRPRFLKTILLNEPFRSAIPHRGVRIYGAYFEDKIDLGNASIERPMLIENSIFKSQVNMRRFSTTNIISFSKSRFDGTLDLIDASLGGDLFMKNAIFNVVNLRAVKIADMIDMIGSKFESRLDLIDASIGGHLFMRRAVLQDADLVKTKIGGQIDMIGSKFEGKLNMDSVSINSDLYMKKAKFKEVILRGAKIGGFVTMESSEFKGWLDMDSALIGDHLYMSEDAIFNNVFLRRVQVGGDLDMSVSTLIGRLDMDSAFITGKLLMQEAQFDKPANLTFLTVGSIFDVRSAVLRGLDLTGARIKRELWLGSADWQNIEWKNYKDENENSRRPKLKLRNASVDILQDTEDTWPDSLEREFEGFKYQSLGGFGTNEKETPYKRSSEWFVNWLAKDKTYSPQPYLHLASVLRAAGHDDKADEILYANREREFREPKTSPRRKWVLSVLKETIGYGFGLGYFQALRWVLGFVLLGAFFLRINEESYVKKTKNGNRIERLGLWYSLDMLLPVIHLREEHYDVDLETHWVRIYFYMHKVIGYLLIFFVIAGLTGLTEWGQSSQGRNMLNP